MRALFAALALSASATPALADEAPAIDGVWQGRIGNLPVHACLMDVATDRARGSYFYLSQMEPIALDKLPDGQGWQEDAGAKARWTITMAGANRITGSWTTGERTLPVTLSRVPMDADGEVDGACMADAYLAPRLVPPKLVAKPEVTGKFGFTRLVKDVGKGFAQVDISTFQLPVQRPGDQAINTALRALLNPRDGRADYIACMKANLFQTGTDGDLSFEASPAFVSTQFVSAALNEGGTCGGAHPYVASSHLTFDRASGKEVELGQWLAPKGMDVTWDPGAKYFERRIKEGLRRLVLAQMPEHEDAECNAARAEADYWDVALTPTGLTFEPDLPHALLACGDVAELSFAQLAPFLSPAGKAGAARMKGPVLLP